MGMGFSFVPEYLLKFLGDHVQVVATEFELPTLQLYASFRKNSKNAALQLITQELKVQTQLN
jgi:LysR family hca operon transcriptional activator